MKQRSLLLITLVIFVIGLIVGVVFLNQRQDIRQRAAGGKADLEVRMFRLTDAAGNVRTRFYSNEDIYVSVIIRNSGDVVGESTDGITTSQIYSNRPSPVAFNTTSDVNISLRNGEFGVFDGSGDSQYRYDSRLNGQGQDRFTTTPYLDNAERRYSWRRVEPGTYTARILLNSDRHVDEANFDNNQAAISYEVIPFSEGAESGGVHNEIPTEFAGPPCITRNAVNLPGVTGCVQQITDDRRTVFGRITNNTDSPIRVLLASYKEYYPWANPQVIGCSRADCPENYLQVWTQTFHKAKETQVPVGATRYLSTQVPECAWQTDIFILGNETTNFPMSFNPTINIYRRGVQYIDGWYHFYPNNDPGDFLRCEKDDEPLPSVTPTPIPSTTPTNTPSPSPTRIPSPTPTGTLTPTPSDAPTATPTPPACIIPEEVTNIRISCPTCEP